MMVIDILSMNRLLPTWALVLPGISLEHQTEVIGGLHTKQGFPFSFF